MTDNSEQLHLIREESPVYTPEQRAEKETYRARLHAFLEDPASRLIEGFPIGENDAILALSDPPYYTACPNPFLGEIIEKWQKERKALQAEKGEEKYHREPFAADVSEGKNDPIYNAHSYHTKVPHKAIMRYILHYTQPGDIVLDGFCGTGMTGVAAQLCGDRKTVESLGYRVNKKGQALDEKGEVITNVGARKAVLVDLSPAATFIAYNYNNSVDVTAFENAAKRIMHEVEEECGWMYKTLHTNGKTEGRINFTIWSDVFLCPACNQEIIYWNAIVDEKTFEIKERLVCPNCSAEIRNPERAWEIVHDEVIGQNIKRAKKVAAYIDYSVKGKRFGKDPDSFDLELLSNIDKIACPYWFPIERMPIGDESRRNDDIGITHVHHYYTKRNLIVIASLLKRTQTSFPLFTFGLLNTAWHATLMRRFNAGGGHRPLSGTLYLPSLSSEGDMLAVYQHKLNQLSLFLRARKNAEATFLITTQSSTAIHAPTQICDYIFIDPPFGSNISYSDLNFIWEAWLKVITQNDQEAIISPAHNRFLSGYQYLMEEGFRNCYQMLKPGHWMTVEFHNSQNRVWNAIQEAIQRAGFVIADIRVLDKQQSSFKQYTATGTVKQDLVISSYKPNDNLEERFRLQAGSVEGAWAFIRYHLGQLPVAVEKSGELETIAERQDFLLFDRMLAFHIQRGAAVPLSASEFYAGVRQRFVERDGMFFLPEQVPQYDAARLRLGHIAQLALFVKDEKSAIQWLRQNLDPALGGEPKTRQDITPDFQR